MLMPYRPQGRRSRQSSTRLAPLCGGLHFGPPPTAAPAATSAAGQSAATGVQPQPAVEEMAIKPDSSCVTDESRIAESK
jgi:hypothetical protein